MTREPSRNTVSSLKFDYDTVPLSVAKFLRGQADRIRRHCVTSIIQIGKALNESKRHLSHGAFLIWVESEVCLPVRTAQAYMRVAKWAVEKGATVAHLAPSTLYLLSTSSTPNDYVVEILNRAKNGEVIAPSDVRSELKRLRSNGHHDAGNMRQFKLARTARTPVLARNIGERESRCCVAELAAFLMRVLSADDFERVRQLLIDDAVLSDPNLPETLRRVFAHAGGTPHQKSSGHETPRPVNLGTEKVEAAFGA